MRLNNLASLSLSALLVLSISLVGCGSTAGDNTSNEVSSSNTPENGAKAEETEPEYIDDQAVSIIAEGYENE